MDLAPPLLPARIGRLTELAYNLWWSWHPEARALFAAIDPTVWAMTAHNPVKLLREVVPTRLLMLSQDPAFLRRYDAVMIAFDADLAARDTWFARSAPDLAKTAIAYLSAEFGIHNSLPIYSGGLGILAGDHCKEASDLGVPIVGGGFMYPQGYFRQRITAGGWQQAEYVPFNRLDFPIPQAMTPSGSPCQVKVEMGRPTVSALVWQVR